MNEGVTEGSESRSERTFGFVVRVNVCHNRGVRCSMFDGNDKCAFGDETVSFCTRDWVVLLVVKLSTCTCCLLEASC